MSIGKWTRERLLDEVILPTILALVFAAVIGYACFVPKPERKYTDEDISNAYWQGYIVGETVTEYNCKRSENENN